MLTSQNRKKHIADRLFYGIIILLVLVLGGLGALITHQRVREVGLKVEKRMYTTATYLGRVLPQAVAHLNARQIRKEIENAASDELRAVEIFDRDDERIYVYERAGENNVVYDRKIERNLELGGEHVGKMIAYFSLSEFISSLRIKEFLRLVVLISAAGMVLAVGLYCLVKRLIIRPITTTLAFSNELAEGNYSKRIDITSNDEMGLLQRSLNSMADALQDNLENLKASFCEAEGAHQQALEASRLKSEFLASMSHEIRTPVNAIVGFADILLEGEKDEEKRGNLKTIKKSANILLENIGDILDFSKMEAGKLRLSESELILRDLFEEITPIISLRLHGKDVEFRKHIDAELEKPIVCDRIRLRQVLLNVLINSAKFTHKGAIDLSVSFEKDKTSLLFKAEDTGIGIPKGYQERVFEPFIQVDGGITREYGGTGLGLAIAKRLVEMMGGKIWVESTEGLGTTFYFTVAAK